MCIRYRFLPLCAVRMARVAFTVLISEFENETVGPLHTIRALFHTVGAILKMETLGTVVCSLHKQKKGTEMSHFVS